MSRVVFDDNQVDFRFARLTFSEIEKTVLEEKIIFGGNTLWKYDR